MELGQRLKQARLEAGLSQRQLCGNTITRNMLSQIENGSARPSMDTLRYLADQLGKSVTYFLDGGEASSNHQPICDARQAWQAGYPRQALTALDAYQGPDPLLDPEYHLLRCLILMDLSEASNGDAALDYLRQADEAGRQTIYYTRELERRRILRLAQLDASVIPQTINALDDQELLLRSAAALQAGDVDGCIRLLALAKEQTAAHWLLLRGDASMATEDFSVAAQFYHQAENLLPDEAYPRLEQLYLKLEDYKQAYYYACRQRNESNYNVYNKKGAF